MFLFTLEDVQRAPKEPDNMASDDDTEGVFLSATAHVLADRLDALGIGRKAVEAAFHSLVKRKLELLKSIRNSVGDRADAELTVWERLSLAGWIDLVISALA
jgi:hypothetical protein